MIFIDALDSTRVRPQITPAFKKPERTLLSIFMRLLEIVPVVRGEFLAQCNFGSGKTSTYQSFMEVTYSKAKYPEGRPDGLLHCKRGSKNWSAFVEAKCGKSSVSAAQIQTYVELASAVGVDSIISISNEFARNPKELPYHIAMNKRRKRDIFHFSWSDIRNRISLLQFDERLTELEQELIADCLRFFESKESGIMSYDAMPKEWSDFVQSSGVGVGFTSKTPGITELIHGWHQERRDLRSKLMALTRQSVQIKPSIGTQAAAEQILDEDRKTLAENYELNAEYSFSESRFPLRILCELQDRKTSVSIDIKAPENKGARASISWFVKKVEALSTSKTNVIFDWKGRGNQRAMLLEDFLKDPDKIMSDNTDAPKRITVTRQVHDVRRFKSAKNFIVDLEKVTFSLVQEMMDAKLL